jgi:hypothetical protein
MKRSTLRTKILDLYILTISIIAILGGIFLLGYCWFGLQIINIRPYLLYGFTIFLGISGIRYYRKEVEL